MNLKDMNYFLRICEKNSISAAAESLYLSPQALSKTVQRLEREVGAALLFRSKNGIRLTVYGELFRESAQTILREYDDMERKIHSLSMQNRGMLRMASAFGVLRYLTPEFVNTFSQQHPDIHLEYMEFPDRYAVENVRENNCDIGLVPYTARDEELEYLDLFHSEIYFVTHKGSRFYDCSEVSIRDVAAEPFVVENTNFIIHDILLQTCETEQVTPELYFNTSGFSLCYKLCQEGRGNTLSMSFIYADMKENGLRMIPFREHPVWKVALIYRKDAVLSAPVRKLIRFSRSWCRDLTP